MGQQGSLDVLDVSGTLQKGIGEISSVAQNIETDVTGLAGEVISGVTGTGQQIVSGVVGTAQQVVGETGQTIRGAEAVIQDSLRGGLKTINNVGSNMLYSGRFVSKNVVGVVDNQFDNMFQVVDSARTDIANTVQIGVVILATGVAMFFILYGDKVLKRGFQVGEFSLF